MPCSTARILPGIIHLGMLSTNDIEAELSYAYLHAVASRAGIACQSATRGHDLLGIDATLTLVRDFGGSNPLTEISIHVQLKATTKPAAQTEHGWSYWLDDLREYDRLRAPRASSPPRLLVVLFLPRSHDEWLVHSVESLLLRRCAYWVSLVGAEESRNEHGQTIYLPASQELSPDGLLAIFRRLSMREELRYAR